MKSYYESPRSHWAYCAQHKQRGIKCCFSMFIMGFAKDDAEGIMVIVVLAIVFGWMFAAYLRLYVLGIIITVLAIVCLFISQELRELFRTKIKRQIPKQ